MKKLEKYTFFEIVNYAILSIAFIISIYVIVYFIFAEKQLNYYYLSSSEQGFAIALDIDNMDDKKITINGMPMEEAIKYVKELNDNLANVKKLKK
jgi:hypothetical protein